MPVGKITGCNGIHQLQVFDQQVRRDQAAGEIHRKDDGKADELAARNRLGQRVGTQHSQNHVVDRAEERDEDRVFVSIPDQAGLKGEGIGLHRHLGRPEHQALISQVHRVGHNGHEEGVVEGVENQDAEQRQEKQENEVCRAESADTVLLINMDIAVFIDADVCVEFCHDRSPPFLTARFPDPARG